MSAYESVRPAVEWLDRRIQSAAELTPEVLRDLYDVQLAQGLVGSDGRPFCPFLRPLVMPLSLYRSVSRAAELLGAACERICERSLEDEALMAELGLTPREERMARIDPGYRTLCVNSRFDAYINETGFFFLEYNAESPAGVTDQMLTEGFVFDLPHIREFLSRYDCWRPRPHERVLAALLETYREWGGGKERPLIAVVDWYGVTTAGEFGRLQSYFEAEGYPTLICDPRELEYDGGSLSAGGRVIDVVYKRVLTHEFLQRYDETHPLARAYADRQVLVANSFRSKMAHKKSALAILSDPRYEHLFTPEQVACARRHVPWTRRVRAGVTTFDGSEWEMTDLLRSERRRLVIKPNDDYGGRGVLIGGETEPQVWERAVARALSEPHVVQERVPAERVVMPSFTGGLEWVKVLVDYDPFLFRGEAHGGIVRLSTTSLTNVALGGSVAALLVLRGDQEPV